jgi:hypothetical protein
MLDCMCVCVQMRLFVCTCACTCVFILVDPFPHGTYHTELVLPPPQDGDEEKYDSEVGCEAPFNLDCIRSFFVRLYIPSQLHIH